MSLRYSVVIATRNRLSALRLSVPRMLSQSRPPTQLIVVDSSDEHGPVATALQELCQQSPVKLIVRHSERGASIQRNIGLDFVETPVVFFPDDDSIFFPGTAQEIIETYERDTTGSIAAVCAAESATPPEDFLVVKTNYKMSKLDRLRARVQRYRSRLEQCFFPDPGAILGRSLFHTFPLDPQQVQSNVTPVAWMTGFRMTFRTDVIQRFKFDINLTRYSLFEDRAASYKAWQMGAVVGARNAKIYHYRSPEKRDNGRRMGAQQLLNLAYVIASNSPVGHPARRALRRFGTYKTLLYSTSTKDSFGKDRYNGAKDALKEIPLFITAAPENAAQIYRTAMERCAS